MQTAAVIDKGASSLLPPKRRQQQRIVIGADDNNNNNKSVFAEGERSLLEHILEGNGQTSFSSSSSLSSSPAAAKGRFLRRLVADYAASQHGDVNSRYYYKCSTATSSLSSSSHNCVVITIVDSSSKAHRHHQMDDREPSSSPSNERYAKEDADRRPFFTAFLLALWRGGGGGGAYGGADCLLIAQLLLDHGADPTLGSLPFFSSSSSPTADLNSTCNTEEHRRVNKEEEDGCGGSGSGSGWGGGSCGRFIIISGNTALHEVALNSSTARKQFHTMMGDDADADGNITDKKKIINDDPPYTSSLQGRVVKAFAEKGALDTLNAKGDTALSIALRNKRDVEMSLLLLKRGADPTCGLAAAFSSSTIKEKTIVSTSTTTTAVPLSLSSSSLPSRSASANVPNALHIIANAALYSRKSDYKGDEAARLVVKGFADMLMKMTTKTNDNLSSSIVDALCLCRVDSVKNGTPAFTLVAEKGEEKEHDKADEDEDEGDVATTAAKPFYPSSYHYLTPLEIAIYRRNFVVADLLMSKCGAVSSLKAHTVVTNGRSSGGGNGGDAARAAAVKLLLHGARWGGATIPKLNKVNQKLCLSVYQRIVDCYYYDRCCCSSPSSASTRPAGTAASTTTAAEAITSPPPPTVVGLSAPLAIAIANNNYIFAESLMRNRPNLTEGVVVAGDGDDDGDASSFHPSSTGNNDKCLLFACVAQPRCAAYHHNNTYRSVYAEDDAEDEDYDDDAEDYYADDGNAENKTKFRTFLIETFYKPIVSAYAAQGLLNIRDSRGDTAINRCFPPQQHQNSSSVVFPSAAGNLSVAHLLCDAGCDPTIGCFDEPLFDDDNEEAVGQGVVEKHAAEGEEKVEAKNQKKEKKENDTHRGCDPHDYYYLDSHGSTLLHRIADIPSPTVKDYIIKCFDEKGLSDCLNSSGYSPLQTILASFLTSPSRYFVPTAMHLIENTRKTFIDCARVGRGVGATRSSSDDVDGNDRGGGEDGNDGSMWCLILFLSSVYQRDEKEYADRFISAAINKKDPSLFNTLRGLNGRTALLLAITKGLFNSALRMILAGGADCTIGCDESNGNTCLHASIQCVFIGEQHRHSEEGMLFPLLARAFAEAEGDEEEDASNTTNNSGDEKSRHLRQDHTVQSTTTASSSKRPKLINATNKAGKTALCCALEVSSLQRVQEILLDCGADPLAGMEEVVENLMATASSNKSLLTSTSSSSSSSSAAASSSSSSPVAYLPPSASYCCCLAAISLEPWLDDRCLTIRKRIITAFHARGLRDVAIKSIASSTSSASASTASALTSTLSASAAIPLLAKCIRQKGSEVLINFLLNDREKDDPMVLVTAAGGPLVLHVIAASYPRWRNATLFLPLIMAFAAAGLLDTIAPPPLSSLSTPPPAATKKNLRKTTFYQTLRDTNAAAAAAAAAAVAVVDGMEAVADAVPVGYTALAIAIQEGQIDLAMALLSHGAQHIPVVGTGETSLHLWAQHKNCDELITMLRKEEAERAQLQMDVCPRPPSPSPTPSSPSPPPMGPIAFSKMLMRTFADAGGLDTVTLDDNVTALMIALRQLYRRVKMRHSIPLPFITEFIYDLMFCGYNTRDDNNTNDDGNKNANNNDHNADDRRSPSASVVLGGGVNGSFAYYGGANPLIGRSKSTGETCLHLVCGSLMHDVLTSSTLIASSATSSSPSTPSPPPFPFPFMAMGKETWTRFAAVRWAIIEAFTDSSHRDGRGLLSLGALGFAPLPSPLSSRMREGQQQHHVDEDSDDDDDEEEEHETDDSDTDYYDPFDDRFCLTALGKAIVEEQWFVAGAFSASGGGAPNNVAVELLRRGASCCADQQFHHQRHHLPPTPAAAPKRATQNRQESEDEEGDNEKTKQEWGEADAVGGEEGRALRHLVSEASARKRNAQHTVHIYKTHVGRARDTLIFAAELLDVGYDAEDVLFWACGVCEPLSVACLQHIPEALTAKANEMAVAASSPLSTDQQLKLSAEILYGSLAKVGITDSTLLQDVRISDAIADLTFAVVSLYADQQGKKH